tara:strand:- start:844 stop:1035 length:192 start_codon:yes stop_codon:yes gene_type:complete
LIIDMKSSEILYQLQDLREIWRKQSFVLSQDQQQRYEELKQLRRDRVAEMYANDMVYKPGSSK